MRSLMYSTSSSSWGWNLWWSMSAAPYHWPQTFDVVVNITAFLGPSNTFTAIGGAPSLELMSGPRCLPCVALLCAQSQWHRQLGLNMGHTWVSNGHFNGHFNGHMVIKPWINHWTPWNIHGYPILMHLCGGNLGHLGNGVVAKLWLWQLLSVNLQNGWFCAEYEQSGVPLVQIFI